MSTNSLTALVTGGTSGVGRTAATKLAQLGVYVLVVGRNRECGEKAVAEMRSAGAQADSIAYGPSGVRVNAVSPGPTRTEGTDAMGEGLEQLAAQAPAGRPATAEEIAEAIVFLATDRSSFIQGAKLAVDGDRTAI